MAICLLSDCYFFFSLSVRSCWVVCFQSEVEERLQRLEGDKESLQMQVSILMDQIEVQTEKIGDLEKNLTEKTICLQRVDEKLQKVSYSLFFKPIY